MSETARPPDLRGLDDEFVIDNLETLKVVADPLRKRILECFDKPRTVKEAARMLGTNPSKLYYHVNLLEEHGLLKVTDTRIVSGIIEKQYQIVAANLRIKAGLLSPAASDGGEGLNVVFAHMFDEIKDELREGIRAGIVDVSEDPAPHRKPLLMRLKATFMPDQAQQFTLRLRALIEEFGALDADENDPDALTYSLGISFFPSESASVPGDDN